MRMSTFFYGRARFRRPALSSRFGRPRHVAAAFYAGNASDVLVLWSGMVFASRSAIEAVFPLR
jgi:hypothetical protein